METELKQAINRLCTDIEMHSQFVFRFNGGDWVDVSNLAPPAQIPGHPVHPVPDHATVRSLQSLFYWHLYCHGGDAPELGEVVSPDAHLMAALSQANTSEERWDGGWWVFQFTSDESLVSYKGGFQRLTKPGEFILDGPWPSPQGTTAHLYSPKESFELQPGFYFAFGETLGDNMDSANPMVRFYFNVNVEGAAPLLRGVTEALNGYQVPFHMKSLTTPSSYSRRDAAVLYVPASYSRITLEVLRYLGEDAVAGLEEGTPLFTKPVLRGIGFAEDPGGGESFGMHRCRLLAEGIVDAFIRGPFTPEDRLRAIEKRFEFNGLDLATAHMGPRLMATHSKRKIIGGWYEGFGTC